MVWFSPFTPWHWREKGPARILLLAWAVAALIFARTIATSLMLCLALLTLLALIAMMQRRYINREWFPFVAVTKEGFFVSKTGRPGEAILKSWNEIGNRLTGKDRSWRFGADVTRHFNVVLDYNATREMFSELNAFAKNNTTSSRAEGAVLEWHRVRRMD